MITLLTGENDFEVKRAVDEIVRSFGGLAERIDGEELELKQLPDLLMGTSLFAEKRLVIIKHLSDNRTIWPVLGEWLARLSDDVTLVLIEPKPDKRTKTYKDLQKLADVKEFKVWTDRDMAQATKWVIDEAEQQGLKLTSALARQLVERVGVDQWELAQAINKLAVLEMVNAGTLENVIEARPTENVFQLFELALKGDTARLQTMLETLRLSEDPYRVFGLLSGQAFQLAVLAVADKSAAEVAKDIGAHPFVLSKLASHAKDLGHSGAKKVIDHMATADQKMKSSATDPWLLIERALLKIAVI